MEEIIKYLEKENIAFIRSSFAGDTITIRSKVYVSQIQEIIKKAYQNKTFFSTDEYGRFMIFK